MIKASIFVAAASGIVVVAACGPSSPADACDQIVSSVCAKIYQCVDPTTIKNTLGYTSQDDCTTKMEAQYNCVNLTCPSNTTFNSSAASTCNSDIQKSACIQGGGAPPSCQASAICQ